MNSKTNLKIKQNNYFSIEEVCEIAEVERGTLVRWELQFSILEPHKDKFNNKIYSSQDVDIVLRIKNLIDEDRYSSCEEIENKLTAEFRESKREVVSKKENSISGDKITLENALRRIEKSRKKYLVPETDRKNENIESNLSESLQKHLKKVEKLTDRNVLDLVNLQLSASQEENLSELLEKNSEGFITIDEKKQLDELIEIYNDALLTKAKAIRVAVERGLIEPLSSE